MIAKLGAAATSGYFGSVASIDRQCFLCYFPMW
jgi:hypothetical protein